MMKRYNVMIYSANPKNKIGDYIKNIFLDNNIMVEITGNLNAVAHNNNHIDCLFINYSDMPDNMSTYDLDIFKLSFVNQTINAIYYITDNEVSMPSFVNVILTKDLTKSHIISLINKMLTKSNSAYIESLTRSRAIVINNLCNDGFSTRYNGTIMLVDAIIQAIINNKLVVNLRKDIYPFLMQKYGISNSCVELSINKAITHAYSSGVSCKQFNGTPTNKELLTYKICELYDYISDAI